MNKQNIYLSSAYLAPIQYYVALLSHNRIFIDGYEHFVKQSYRNRCIIMDASGPMSLTIPVDKKNRATMKDTIISEHSDWQHVHWNAIVSSYNSSPFFEYYLDDFYPFYHNKFKYLFDFNEGLRETIIDLLNVDNLNIEYTETYQMDIGKLDIDLRNAISPKLDWQEGYCAFQPEQYYQVFAQKCGFNANMSIIDLLFNMGNESILILKDSKITCNSILL